MGASASVQPGLETINEVTNHERLKSYYLVVLNLVFTSVLFNYINFIFGKYNIKVVGSSQRKDLGTRALNKSSRV